MHATTIVEMMKVRDLSDEDARYVRKHLELGRKANIKARNHFARCRRRLQDHDARRALRDARAAHETGGDE